MDAQKPSNHDFEKEETTLANDQTLCRTQARPGGGQRAGTLLQARPFECESRFKAKENWARADALSVGNSEEFQAGVTGEEGSGSLFSGPEPCPNRTTPADQGRNGEELHSRSYAD